VNDTTIATQTVLICQHRACRRAGAAEVLKAFQAAQPDVTIQPVRCLGQCGNGPMVLVLPERIWYDQVQPAEVPAVVQRHLQQGRPIQTMLYRKFHPQR
jgi:(2Fe-2S) ferredoxin